MLKVLLWTVDAFLRQTVCSMRDCLEQDLWNQTINLVSKKKKVGFFSTTCSDSKSERRNIARTSLATSKVLQVLPSRQIGPDYTANSQWQTDWMQAVWKVLCFKHILRLLFSPRLVQPYTAQFPTFSQLSHGFTSWFQSNWHTGWMRHSKTVPWNYRDGLHI